MNNMIVDYASSSLQMGDLLIHYNVDFNDFSQGEKKSLLKSIKRYMNSGSTESVVIDLHKIKLRLKGADELSYLMPYIPQNGDSDA